MPSPEQDAPRGARPTPDVRGVVDALGVMRWDMHADAAGVASRTHLPDGELTAGEMVSDLTALTVEIREVLALLVTHREQLVDVDELQRAAGALEQAGAAMRAASEHSAQRKDGGRQQRGG